MTWWSPHTCRSGSGWRWRREWSSKLAFVLRPSPSLPREVCTSATPRKNCREGTSPFLKDNPSYEDLGEVNNYAEDEGHGGDDLAGDNDDVMWKMAMDGKVVQA
jgi:hypothetical protein